MLSRMRLMGVAAAMLVFFSPLTGCSMKTMIVRNMNPIIEDMNIAVNRNMDVELVREAMPAGLIQLDGLITSSPNNSQLLLSAAEGTFGYSYAFVEDSDKERASKLYLKARDYAVRVLVGKGPDSKAFLDKPLDEFTAALNGFGRSDAPAMYWTSSAWMAWAGLNINKPETLMAVPKIEAMLLKCVELDEGFYNGAGHAALGAFYASRAKVIGGDPDKALQHFNRAFEISKSRVLFFHVLKAQYYCYQIQDRDLFETTLKTAIEAPADIYPEKGFANEVARRKARDLLDRIDDLF
jgi:hypothetical protein